MNDGYLVRSHFTYCYGSKADFGDGALEEERTAPSRGGPGTLGRTIEGVNGERTIALNNG